MDSVVYRADTVAGVSQADETILSVYNITLFLWYYCLLPWQTVVPTSAELKNRMRC